MALLCPCVSARSRLVDDAQDRLPLSVFPWQGFAPGDAAQRLPRLGIDHVGEGRALTHLHSRARGSQCDKLFPY